MSVLLIAVIAVIIIFAIIGYRRGLLGILFNVFSWIFIALFVLLVNPYIYNFIATHTTWQTTISESTSSFVDDKISELAPNAIGSGKLAANDLGNVNSSDLTDGLSEYGVTLPGNLVEQLVTSIRSSANEVSSNVTQQATTLKNNVVHGISDTISTYIIRGIACLIAFLIAKIICLVVYTIIRIVQDVPVVHGATSFIGMILGAFKGLLITWLFMYIVSITLTTSFGAFFMPMIAKSTFLSFLYNNNLIEIIIMYFF